MLAVVELLDDDVSESVESIAKSLDLCLENIDCFLVLLFKIFYCSCLTD